jgi:3'-phosphoadenosine 5'-phosphosulfate sulfotransferase (PAPS reductase)/FAD synthetase
VTHVITFSGGISSWGAAKRVVERYGTQNVRLLFADTRMEDEDTYRFLIEAAANVGAPLSVISEGRTPWQVMFDEGFLGNSRMDPCSRILKREMIDKWLTENCDRPMTSIYVGIDWTEEHRYTKLRDLRRAEGWYYYAPLCEPPYVTKSDLLLQLKAEGIRPPRLYEAGFSHNNCGGFCIKAGQGHYKRLLEFMPERFAHHEAQEQALIAQIGKPVSILTDRTGDGKKKPLTLKDFRIRVESGRQVDAFDIGGCGCFVEEAA